MGSFRVKLMLAMMLVVSAITVAGFYLAQRSVMAAAERDLQHDFQNQLAAVHRAEATRHSALAERCLSLVANPRLHAALEDNALDLLYPTAKDELRDLISVQTESAPADSEHAHFYRFLDTNGKVIPPPVLAGAGSLTPAEEQALSLHRLPGEVQIGYLARAHNREGVDEVFAMPITASDSGDLIAALVAGFQPVELQSAGAGAGMRSGIWLGDRLHFATISHEARGKLEHKIRRVLSDSHRLEGNFSVAAAGAAYLLFYKRLNAGSVFPPAFEICIYPLADFIAQQHRLRWGIGGAGGLLMIGGLVASHVASKRLSKPVEELAAQSEVNRSGRERAETVLAQTSVELQRAARFSADASHQLKSPVTVLRAGLESLLAQKNFAPEVYDELSSLLHQTYRLTGVINDLLLLSRMDAGRLQLAFSPVNLTRLVNEWLDDLSALPDAAEVEIQTELPPDLEISGERRYTSLIVQNLLENARKYNNPGGKILVTAKETDGSIVLKIGNSGGAIPQSEHEHIFERFHRGAMGEDVPGHGLGLNMARELARLHGGDLWLVESNADWTEFAVRFRSTHSSDSMATRTL